MEGLRCNSILEVPKRVGVKRPLLILSPLFGSQEDPHKATKSEVATSPLTSEGAQSRAEWLHNPCRLGVLRQGDKIKSGYITHAFTECPKESGMAT